MLTELARTSRMIGPLRFKGIFWILTQIVFKLRNKLLNYRFDDSNQIEIGQNFRIISNQWIQTFSYGPSHQDPYVHTHIQFPPYSYSNLFSLFRNSLNMLSIKKYGQEKPR